MEDFMNVSLTPELEKLVQKKVSEGLYNSASEVVREALRLLAEQDRLQEIRIEGVRKKVAAGLKSLDEGKGISGDEIFSKLEARLLHLEGEAKRKK